MQLRPRREARRGVSTFEPPDCSTTMTQFGQLSALDSKQDVTQLAESVAHFYLLSEDYIGKRVAGFPALLPTVSRMPWIPIGAAWDEMSSLYSSTASRAERPFADLTSEGISLFIFATITVSSFAAAAIPLLELALGYAKPNACSGVCVNTHDPPIIRRDDGTYFRFLTGARIAVHSAPDITGPWRYEGAALPAGSVIDLPGNQDLWAPEVMKVGNTYYMYCSASTFCSQESAIWVATSPSLDMNTWTDLGIIVQSSRGSPFNAIDPSFLNVGGQPLLTFGSFWEDIHQVSLADPASLATETPQQIAFDPVTTEQEGPALFP
ncbi:hypothetical protein DL771_000431 [Monosporascus sp. 5C6A]|nr:hypothetical protein DL771_000431 [Monosporascus sp. 5C6A]